MKNRNVYPSVLGGLIHFWTIFVLLYSPGKCMYNELSHPDPFKYLHKIKFVPVCKTQLTNIIKNEEKIPDRNVVISHATNTHQDDFIKDHTITFMTIVLNS